MQFRSDTKMADIIHSNYQLLPILNRFDIQLGFGDITVDELCSEKKINTEFFLVIINSFHDHDYFPQDKLLTFPISLIIDYIYKSHQYYLEIKVPEIEAIIHKLSMKAGNSRKNDLKLLERFFSDYKKEIIKHIKDEEDEVLPNVTRLDKAYKSDNINNEHVKIIRDYPIDAYAEKHNNVEEKLYDLKNILIKYLPPADDHDLIYALLIELFRLERDLNDHARIEDKVLIPKVRIMEQNILQKFNEQN